MEKPYKKTDAITKNWVKEAGLVKPSPTFSMDVLQKIEARTQLQPKNPLISTLGWVIIASVLLLSVVFLYVYPSEISVWKTMVDVSTIKWKESMNSINISDTSLYAFVFLSLFLLQVPLLKKLVTARY